MYIGVFLALLLNSAAWSTAIVNSFRQAGSAAVSAAGGTPGVAPSNVLDAGWLILKQVVASMSLWGAGDLILIALAASDTDCLCTDDSAFDLRPGRELFCHFLWCTPDGLWRLAMDESIRD